MIREDLPKTDGRGNMFMYCPYCGHEQKEPHTGLTFGTIVECNRCGRVMCAAGWLYGPLSEGALRR